MYEIIAQKSLELSDFTVYPKDDKIYNTCVNTQRRKSISVI